MEASQTHIRKLLATLNKAKSPSRFTDCKIAVTFRIHNFYKEPWEYLNGFPNWTIENRVVVKTTNDAGDVGPVFTPLNFSSSLDHSLTLMYCVLDQVDKVRMERTTDIGRVQIFSGENVYRGKHKILSIAVLIATFKALEKT